LNEEKGTHICEFSRSRLRRVKIMFSTIYMLVFTKHGHKYDAFDTTN